MAISCNNANTKHLKKASHKMTNYEKRVSKYWLEVLEDRRLTLLISTIKTDLSSTQGPWAPAVDRLFDRCSKRAQISNPSLKAKAYTDFDEVNNDVAVSKYPITLCPEVVSNARLFIAHALEKYSKSYDETNIQISLDMTLLLTNWSYGPGASVGCADTHFVDKISQGVVTCTEQAAPLYKLLRKLNPFLNVNDDALGSSIQNVRGSTLSTVPKNQDTHRTICTEPLGNMALQLAAGRYIEGALRTIGIDLSDQQTKNRRLACKGSLDSSLATIDLKSASDYISVDLIRQLWPDCWTALLLTIRSPEFRHSEVPDRYNVLHMMSTMGNGFTFPMMTLTLAALIYGYTVSRSDYSGRSLYVDWSTHAVFGDDIICPKDSYVGICDTLASAGLRVNLDKSYNEGPFRESCGGDYYNGGFITPFYIESLSCDAEIYVAINKLTQWCSYHEIGLHRSVMLLRKMLQHKVLLVPEWEDPSSGIQTQGAPHRYKKLSVVPLDVEYTGNNPFLLTLCVLGGYVESRSDGTIYFTRRLPSGRKPQYMVKNCRYSKSYRHASDPSLRSHRQSNFVELFISNFSL